jgi:hypothetical protein
MARSSADLAWATVTPKKCRRHQWVAHYLPNGPIDLRYPSEVKCSRCGKPKDEAGSRRGRLNRSRGNAIERAVAKELGLRRVGHFGGPEDVGTAADPFIVQVKSGKSFPERLYRWLRALPSNANQTPILVVTDATGPGHRRRALVVLTLEDWVALHGEVGERGAA